MAKIPDLDPDNDHVRGPAGAHVILEYGDFECPYSRRAFREIARVERQLEGAVRFAFRHFPLMDKHPHAWAASTAAEAAGVQGRFWEMHDLLFPNQAHLEDDDLRRYASDVGLDLGRFEAEWPSDAVARRIARDVQSGRASGEVRGTPTLYIDGQLYRGDYRAPALIEALSASS